MHFHPGRNAPAGALELTGNKRPTGLVWTVMLFHPGATAPARALKVGPKQGVAGALGD